MADHPSDVNALQFTPDRRRLISAGADKPVRVWDLETGDTERTILGSKGKGLVGYIFAMALSRDGSTLAVGGFFALGTVTFGLYEAGTSAGTIRLFDLASGKVLVLLKGHRGAVISLDFSPNGRYLVSSATDATTRLWDIGERRSERVIDKGLAYVAFSPDGRRIANQVEAWTLVLWSAGLLAEVGSPTTRPVFSPDGRYLLLCMITPPYQVQVLSVPDGQGSIGCTESHPRLGRAHRCGQACTTDRTDTPTSRRHECPGRAGRRPFRDRA